MDVSKIHLTLKSKEYLEGTDMVGDGGEGGVKDREDGEGVGYSIQGSFIVGVDIWE